jgi:hypothetical protein
MEQWTREATAAHNHCAFSSIETQQSAELVQTTWFAYGLRAVAPSSRLALWCR